jgi:hypothetical protein
MTEHRLKTWPGQYLALIEGQKCSEYRRNDRGFHVGDWLLLEEWSPLTGAYTGNALWRQVRHIVEGPAFGIPDGFCVMSLR